MPGFVEIEPDAARDRLSAEPDLVLIDVRSVEEFEAGHPVGAWNIPLAMPDVGGMRPNTRFLEAVQSRFRPDTPLILSCAVGGRSAIACQMLHAQGYSTLCNLRGGMSGARDMNGRKLSEGWAGLGLPTSDAPEVGRSWPEILAALDAELKGGPSRA